MSSGEIFDKGRSLTSFLQIDCVPDQDVMDLRNSYYCVSVPGMSQWAKESDTSANQKLELSLEGTPLDV